MADYARLIIDTNKIHSCRNICFSLEAKRPEADLARFRSCCKQHLLAILSTGASCQNFSSRRYQSLSWTIARAMRRKRHGRKVKTEVVARRDTFSSSTCESRVSRISLGRSRRRRLDSVYGKGETAFLDDFEGTCALFTSPISISIADLSMEVTRSRGYIESRL